MVKLVLLRHGESTANEANIYTGWSDVPLTIKGCEQAKVAGKKLKEENITFTKAHTSLLERAIKTGIIVEGYFLYLGSSILSSNIGGTVSNDRLHKATWCFPYLRFVNSLFNPLNAP